MIDTEMDVHAWRRPQAEQGQGHLEQRIDIRHADQAEADPLATMRVFGAMQGMQVQSGIPQKAGKGAPAARLIQLAQFPR